MARYNSDGNTVKYTPSSAVTAGDVVLQGDLIGIAANDIAANDTGALIVSGVVEFPKTGGGGIVFTAGDLAYWDVSATSADTTDDSGTNKLIGKTIAAAADNDTIVYVLMDQ